MSLERASVACISPNALIKPFLVEVIGIPAEILVPIKIAQVVAAAGVIEIPLVQAPDKLNPVVQAPVFRKAVVVAAVTDIPFAVAVSIVIPGVAPLAKKSVLNVANLAAFGYPFRPYKTSTTLFIFFSFLV
jgi:hypothetical protein